jgi:hypothetical protein
LLWSPGPPQPLAGAQPECGCAGAGAVGLEAAACDCPWCEHRYAWQRFPRKTVVVPWGAAHLPYIHAHFVSREVRSRTRLLGSVRLAAPSLAGGSHCFGSCGVCVPMRRAARHPAARRAGRYGPFLQGLVEDTSNRKEHTVMSLSSLCRVIFYDPFAWPRNKTVYN